MTRNRTIIIIVALLVFSLALSVSPWSRYLPWQVSWQEQPREAKQYTVKEKFEANTRCHNSEASGYYILSDDGASILIATTCLPVPEPPQAGPRMNMDFYYIWHDAEPGDRLNVVFDEDGFPEHISLVKSQEVTA